MIRTVRIRNFKGFREEIIPTGALTLLSGLNGMGKSTVLQTLLLLRQSFQQGRLQSEGLSLNGDLVQIGTAVDALYEDAEVDEIAFELTLDNGVQGLWAFRCDRRADVLDLKSPPVDLSMFEMPLFRDDFHYLQAERVGPRTAFPMSDYVVRQHRQLGSRGEYTAHFLSLFGANNIPNASLRHRKEPNLRLRDQVEAWMGEVSPGTRLSLTSHVEMDLMSIQYSIQTGQHVGREYRPTNVGFGISYTLPVVVALLAAPKGSIVLLENPEAHLHPRGQSNMGHLIARAAAAGVQVIVESHSDHVLNGIRCAVHDGAVSPDDVAVHFFVRKEEPLSVRTGRISPSIDRDGRLSEWPEGFFDEWEKSLDTLLEPRGE